MRGANSRSLSNGLCVADVAKVDHVHVGSCMMTMVIDYYSLVPEGGEICAEGAQVKDQSQQDDGVSFQCFSCDIFCISTMLL